MALRSSLHVLRPCPRCQSPASAMALAGMMCLQSTRRLLAGQKHISFSRDQDSSRAYASSTDRNDRQHKTSSPDPKHQQQQAGHHVKGGSRPGSTDAGAREQFLSRAASLGLVRASELNSVPRRRRSMPVQHDNDCDDAAVADGSGPDSRRHSSSGSSECSSCDDTPTSSASSSDFCSSSSSPRRRRSSNSSTSEAPSVESSRSRIITEEDEAIAAAINRLSRFLDFRERCGSEVLAKLSEQGCDGHFARQVLKRLQQMGLQDDARFAEMYARGKWAFKSEAPAKIAYELRMRRVAQEHIDAALAAVFGDSKQLAAREPSDEQQEATWELLVEACRQRVELTHMYPPQKRRQKLATWLQRRGHSLATAFRMFEVLGI